ncbi:peptide-methionine (S)-S-oxide reductase [Modicisalibacter muralis]|uniref:Peptide methionine sulfoxide reductase MsrA n=1 Tax=Modicisalibacter muralis TaxID=119000 RepID=A0A1G9HWI7_9GAMM|nr:peptide-methionine (S)-S-oxide reductase MsrA [Halomonas muralis]SDL17330.1 peptide-methionine (S)-S-oxide reductase [Halomonas muralis]
MLSLLKTPSSGRKRGKPLLGVGAALWSAALFALWQSTASAAGDGVELPPPSTNLPASSTADTQTAVLAGGCFWGMEAVFQHLDGVSDVVSGYSGGDSSTASYRATSSGRTGHAEAVQITYDPQTISYAKLLQVYFSVAHDSTQLNRQGPDVGPQYRSAIFYANDRQQAMAEAYIAQLGEAGVFEKPIVTQVDPLSAFYPAEAYHQNFAYRNPNHRYIVVHDWPKVDNLQRLFADIYRDTPVIVATK